MAKPKLPVKNTGIMLLLSFAAMLVVNSLIILVANSFFPTQVVLGTLAFTPLWALFHSMFMVSVVDTFVIPLFSLYETKRGKKLSSMDWMVGYFLVNLIAIWGVARFSEQFGLGISSWLVAVVLALVLDFVQGIVMMQLEKLRPKFA